MGLQLIWACRPFSGTTRLNDRVVQLTWIEEKVQRQLVQKLWSSLHVTETNRISRYPESFSHHEKKRGSERPYMQKTIPETLV
jgi:hypothetical protein